MDPTRNGAAVPTLKFAPVDTKAIRSHEDMQARQAAKAAKATAEKVEKTVSNQFNNMTELQPNLAKGLDGLEFKVDFSKNNWTKDTALNQAFARQASTVVSTAAVHSALGLGTKVLDSGLILTTQQYELF